MPEVADNCDLCGEEDTWHIDRHLQHDRCSNCRTRHIISSDTEEAFRHEEKTEAERKAMLDDLRAWYEEVNE
ncbi:hypothetical protein [Halorussus sp. AFM4]|uniref:hypothetical protein n=1 Tax=Halorussus sp. AFM4 TaxID=3421651 RepID=UPI003EB6F80F